MVQWYGYMINSALYLYLDIYWSLNHQLCTGIKYLHQSSDGKELFFITNHTFPCWSVKSCYVHVGMYAWEMSKIPCQWHKACHPTQSQYTNSWGTSRLSFLQLFRAEFQLRQQQLAIMKSLVTQPGFEARSHDHSERFPWDRPVDVADL